MEWIQKLKFGKCINNGGKLITWNDVYQLTPIDNKDNKLPCKISIHFIINFCLYRCVRTYSGHRQAIRDIDFNNSGDHFLSTSYDRYIKLWDTETGECVNRFTNNKVGTMAQLYYLGSWTILYMLSITYWQ